MDFDLSEDQRALQDAAARVLGELSSTERVRKVAPELRLDTSLWSAMADQGWLGVERPEGAGGLGLGMVEVSVLCEELGRHVSPVPFLGTVLSAGALSAAL
jgi:alkylation response protein AidB-like acyl-CoA dehydrogenase